MVSARTWYPESIRDSIELGETGIDPRFEDAYFSFSRNISPKTVLSAHALLAHDRLKFHEIDGNETVDASSKSGYFWLRALRSWPGEIISETVLSAGRIDRYREGFSEPEDELVIVDDSRRLDFFGLKSDATWQVSDAHLLRFGIDVRRLDARYRYTSGPADDVASQTSIGLDPNGMSISGYVAHRGRITRSFATEVGLRFDRQTYTQQDQVSPRLNAVWHLGKRTQMRFGLGQYYQSQRIHELRVEDGETQFRRAELSKQVGLTLQHRFAGDLQLRFDAYYKKLSRLQPRYENLFSPVELYPETEADRVLIAAEHARLRGFELLARSAPRRRFNWWVSYAWSKAEDIIAGRGVPRSWDQTHAGKFLIGYRFADQWSVSLTGTAHTGWPTTPVSTTTTTLPDGTTEIVPRLGQRNSARFSPYARLDFKTSRAFTVPGGRIRLLLEVLNLTSRKNTCCVNDFMFTPRPDGSVDTEPDLSTWLGLAPSFSLVWDF